MGKIKVGPSKLSNSLYLISDFETSIILASICCELLVTITSYANIAIDINNNPKQIIDLQIMFFILYSF
jgi:hypothetical protein